jgi:hypothetical protein
MATSFASQLHFNTKKRLSLMLKVSIVDSGAERRLVLEGELISSSLINLRIAWLKACSGRQGRRIVLVFKQVTHISPEGEAALWVLMNRGVRISSGEAQATHVLQQLIRKGMPGEPVHISPPIANDEP